MFLLFLLFHSAVLVDRYIYIFGGLNLETSERYGLFPLRINIFNWEISKVVAGDGIRLEGYLSGATLLPSTDKIFLIGGYSQPVSKEWDKPLTKCEVNATRDPFLKGFNVYLR